MPKEVVYPHELLGELIEIKSYSGEEEKIRDFIAGWFKDRGIESFRQGDNLVIHLEGSDRTRAFLFNSHMDTVAADLDSWKTDPWTPTIKEGKMYGLGASDMKAGLAASMLNAWRIAEKGVPAVDTWFTYVVKEEVDGSGTDSFAEWWETQGLRQQYREAAAIFTEPTELNEIEHGHRGNLFLRVTSSGDSGHASRPHLIKKHAVREMLNFADALQAAMQEWRTEFSSDVFEDPTVGELTSIYSGVGITTDPATGAHSVYSNSINKFPERCIGTFDIRTIPGFHEVVFAKIQALASQHGVEVENAYAPAPAGFTAPSELIVQASLGLINDPKLVVSQGSADLGFLTAKGIKSVIIGPGQKKEMHMPNESCVIEQVGQAANLYGAIVDSWVQLSE